MERAVPITTEAFGCGVIIFRDDGFCVFQDEIFISRILCHFIQEGLMTDEDTLKLDTVVAIIDLGLHLTKYTLVGYQLRGNGSVGDLFR